MAILQATKVSSGTEQMPGIGDGQSLKCVSSTYTYSGAAIGAADVIQSALIQAGSVVVDVMVVNSGLGTSGTLQIGYGGDPDYFATTAAASTGAVIRASAVTALPLLLTTNDTIDVTVVAAGAGTSGTITINVFFLPRNA